MILCSARWKETGWGNANLLNLSSAAIKWNSNTGKTHLSNLKGHPRPSSFLATCRGINFRIQPHQKIFNTEMFDADFSYYKA